jgi:hypothetical protein
MGDTVRKFVKKQKSARTKTKAVIRKKAKKVFEKANRQTAQINYKTKAKFPQ